MPPLRKSNIFQVIPGLLFLIWALPSYAASDNEDLNLNDTPLVKVLYATDRAPLKGPDLFADKPSKPQTISYGETEVALDLAYRRNKNKDANWLRFLPQGKTTNAFLRPEEFKGRLGRARNLSKDRTFIFVHGFNTTFRDGALFAAQIAYDLQLEETPILYSWPSAASVFAYNQDHQMVKNNPQTRANLVEFLKNIAAHPPAKEINLVAHSMGCYLLSLALEDIVKDPQYGAEFVKKIHSITLISADICSVEFTRDVGESSTGKKAAEVGIYGRLKPFFKDKITIYASAKDWVLDFSADDESINHKCPRLGQAGKNLVVLDGMTTIDATQVASNLDELDLGHNLPSHDGVIDDLYLTLNQGLGPGQRLLTLRQKDGLPYYEIFDGVHNLEKVDDYNWITFGMSAQLGVVTYDFTNQFKLDASFLGRFQLEVGYAKGILPSSADLRLNLGTERWRPYLNFGAEYFGAGSGADTVTSGDLRAGLGLEIMTDTGWGFALGESWTCWNLGWKGNIQTQPTIDTLVHQTFPNGEFYLQLSKYFAVHI